MHFAVASLHFASEAFLKSNILQRRRRLRELLLSLGRRVRFCHKSCGSPAPFKIFGKHDVAESLSRLGAARDSSIFVVFAQSNGGGATGPITRIAFFRVANNTRWSLYSPRCILFRKLQPKAASSSISADFAKSCYRFGAAHDSATVYCVYKIKGGDNGDNQRGAINPRAIHFNTTNAKCGLRCKIWVVC